MCVSDIKSRDNYVHCTVPEVSSGLPVGPIISQLHCSTATGKLLSIENRNRRCFLNNHAANLSLSNQRCFIWRDINLRHVF